MDRLERCGAIATLALTLALAACGGGSAADAAAAAASGSTTQAVQGVATPNSVSVVTAKNAE